MPSSIRKVFIVIEVTPPMPFAKKNQYPNPELINLRKV